LAIENSGGATANGAFLFGRGSNTGDLIRAEVDGAAGLYRLSGGGASVALPIPGAFAATDRYDLNVEWDPASSTVSLRHLTNSVQLVVSPPPATVDHIGYAVDNAQTDFTPVTICLDAPPLVSRGWCRPDGLFRLRYQRPATQTGRYSHEASTNLLHWTAAPVGRVQAVTGFGELQQVSADFPDRSRAAGASPQLFYRIHYTP
jgi:hypothetical protein